LGLFFDLGVPALCAVATFRGSLSLGPLRGLAFGHRFTSLTQNRVLAMYPSMLLGCFAILRKQSYFYL
jgi:hypothetical protein